MAVSFTQKGKPWRKADIFRWGAGEQEECFGQVMFERILRPLNENSKYTLGYMSLELKKSGVET